MELPQKSRRKKSIVERVAAGDLTEVETLEATREAALSSLDRAMQSRFGLQAKLVQRGYPAETVEIVLDRLEAVGVLDDNAYAQALVRARLEHGLAPRAIAAELQRKGISSEIAQAALEPIDDVQQIAQASQIATKVVSRCQGLSPQVQARKVYDALGRRGYSADLAAQIVASALGRESAFS